MNLKSILSLAILCCSIQWSAAQWSFELGAGLNCSSQTVIRKSFVHEAYNLNILNYQLGIGYKVKPRGQINFSYRPTNVQLRPVFYDCYVGFDSRYNFNQWFAQEFGLGYEFQMPMSKRLDFLAEFGTTYTLTNYKLTGIEGAVNSLIRIDHMLGVRAKAKLAFNITRSFSILYSFNMQYGAAVYDYKQLDDRSGNFGVFSIEPLHGISLRYRLPRRG